MGDVRECRTLPAKPHTFFHSFIGAGDHGFHPILTEIADPAGKLMAICLLRQPVPKSHALNAAGDDQMQARHAGQDAIKSPNRHSGLEGSGR